MSVNDFTAGGLGALRDRGLTTPWRIADAIPDRAARGTLGRALPVLDDILAARDGAPGARDFTHVDRLYVQLGSLQYQLVGPVTGLESTSTADFAEHAVIEGKPRLQFIGMGLDVLTLTFAFHSMFGDPDLEIGSLYAAMAAHQAMPLVWANGVVRGRYVITQCEETITRTDALGRIIAADVRLTLKEWVEDVALEVKTPRVTKPKPAAAKPAVEPTATANTDTLEQMLAEASKRKIAVYNPDGTISLSVVADGVPGSVITRRPP